MRETNRQLLLSAARLLRPVLDDLVFVGGCATGLLITDEAAPSVRATFDVDAIVEATSYPKYVQFGGRLREIGFREDTSEGAPLCRWRNGEVTLDVMPLDEQILGFSNRWYKEAMAAAEVLLLEPSLQIRIINAPYFLATKLEAFKGRSGRDYFASRDLEDVISVVDGRLELVEEIQIASDDLRAYLTVEFSTLLRDLRFTDALPGHLPPDAASQARIPLILGRIEELTRGI